MTWQTVARIAAANLCAALANSALVFGNTTAVTLSVASRALTPKTPARPRRPAPSPVATRKPAWFDEMREVRGE